MSWITDNRPARVKEIGNGQFPLTAADLAPFANVGVRASLHHPPAME